MSTPTPDQSIPDWLAGELKPYLSAAYSTSLIRTLVPVGIGSVLTYINAHWHLVLPAHASSTLIITATAVTVGAYYAAARWVERRWPRIGRWLIALGVTDAAPTYTPPAVTAKLTPDGPTR